MRLKKKILRGVTAAVLAAVLLTACAGGGEAPAPSNPDNNTMGGGTVTIPTEPEKPTPTEPEKPTPNPTEPERPEPSEPETPTEPDEPSDGIEWTYKDNGNGTATLTGYNKSGEKVPSGAVTIPRKVGEKKLTVTAIGNNCFYQDSNITSVIIPDTVKSIGVRAFSTCKNLSAVSFPEGLQTIGTYAFALDALIEVVVPKSVTKMEDGVFYHNAALQSATILGNVSLGFGTFYQCSSLQNVQIVGEVLEIPTNTFSDCKQRRY